VDATQDFLPFVTPLEELDSDNIEGKEKDVEWSNGDAHV